MERGYRFGLYVGESEESSVKAIVDLFNITRPDNCRVADTQYLYIQALILAHRRLGNVNSRAADEFVKTYIGKPELDRRGFLNFRNALVDKKWLNKEGRSISLNEILGGVVAGWPFERIGELARFPIIRVKDDVATENPPQ